MKFDFLFWFSVAMVLVNFGFFLIARQLHNLEQQKMSLIVMAISMVGVIAHYFNLQENNKQ